MSHHTCQNLGRPKGNLPSLCVCPKFGQAYPQPFVAGKVDAYFLCKLDEFKSIYSSVGSNYQLNRILLMVPVT